VVFKLVEGAQKLGVALTATASQLSKIIQGVKFADRWMVIV
jgi:hypothetical protein